MKSTINLGYLVFLSVVAALGGFLFGYDTAVISGTIAQVTEQFGLEQLLRLVNFFNWMLCNKDGM